MLAIFAWNSDGIGTEYALNIFHNWLSNLDYSGGHGITPGNTTATTDALSLDLDVAARIANPFERLYSRPGIPEAAFYALMSNAWMDVRLLLSCVFLRWAATGKNNTPFLRDSVQKAVGGAPLTGSGRTNTFVVTFENIVFGFLRIFLHFEFLPKTSYGTFLAEVCNRSDLFAEMQHIAQRAYKPMTVSGPVELEVQLAALAIYLFHSSTGISFFKNLVTSFSSSMPNEDPDFNIKAIWLGIEGLLSNVRSRNKELVDSLEFLNPGRNFDHESAAFLEFMENLKDSARESFLDSLRKTRLSPPPTRRSNTKSRTADI